MPNLIPDREPEQFRAGDTLKFKIYVPDFYPADGWVMSYDFVSASGNYTVTGTDNGDGSHLISETAANTAKWAPGTYSFQGYVTKGQERYTLRTGQIEILQNLATQSNIDTRSHVKKVLDALEATIEGKASKDQQSYTIAGRTLSRLSPSELIKWHNHYKALYAKEVREERIRRGLGHHGIIRTRM